MKTSMDVSAPKIHKPYALCIGSLDENLTLHCFIDQDLPLHIRQQITTMSNLSSTTLANLVNLPIELRNEVYDNLIEEITYLVLPRDFKGSISDYLFTRLPKALKSNEQFASEAAMEYLRRTLRTAILIIVPDTSAFHLDLPENMKWEKVSELEFTDTQRYYARPMDGFVRETKQSSIQEIVARCPNLERLTIAIEDTMILPQTSDTANSTSTEGEDCPERMVKGTPHDVQEPKPDLFLVLDHQKINRVTLNVTNAIPPEWNNYDYTYYKRLIWFTKGFEQEAKSVEKDVNLMVELSPGAVKQTRESIRYVRHKITWIQPIDYFG